MTNYVERCLIVPSAYVQLAKALCVGVAGASGKDMFSTALSPTGKLPATHYISQGMIEDVFADLLPFTWFDEDGEAITGLGDVDTVTTLAQGAATKAQITALLGAIEATEQGSFDALDRRALRLVV
jgi:hypothetical protein